MSIKSMNEILRLREILQEINQASYSYVILNKQYPINSLSEAELDELKKGYERIIDKVIISTKQYEQEKDKTTT